ncbi:MAG TPA: sugar-binding protein, partial [Candidatus Sulfotelmatobacter sp.]|nr:sugar-binding protein [Candidatus Sulfotelmatobacter sp.]
AFKQIMQEPLFAGTAAQLAALTVSPEKTVKRTAVAVKTGGVKIDGKLDDWSNALPIVMKDSSFFKEGLKWDGPADLSGDVYLMWDEQNLYLAAAVTDKIPLVNTKERQDIWNGDGVEMVISTDPGSNPKRESFARSDFQVGFSSGDGKSNKATIWNWQRHRTPAGSEIVVKRSERPLGYVIEAKIPWAFFGSFVPSAGTKVSFDVALDDADFSGEREKQFIWNGDYLFYKDPSVWGVLEFK